MTVFQVEVLTDDGKKRQFPTREQAHSMARQYQKKGFSVAVRPLTIPDKQ